MVSERRGKQSRIEVELSLDDLAILADLAHFYEKSMGPMRFVVAFTTAPKMRRRFRFVQEESKILERVTEEAQQELAARKRESGKIPLTPRAAIAFWGRLLAAINSKRGNRKLAAEDAERRQRLADEFRGAVRGFSRNHEQVIAEELKTRRPVEQIWMREQLEF